MSLVALLILIAVIGLIVWLLVTYIPMPPPFKTAIVVVALGVVALMVLGAFGLLDSLNAIRVPGRR